MEKVKLILLFFLIGFVLGFLNITENKYIGAITEDINPIFSDDFEIDLSKWQNETGGAGYSLVSEPVLSGVKALRLDWGKLSSNVSIIHNGTVEAYFFDNLVSNGYTGIELWMQNNNYMAGRADLGWSSNYYLTQIGSTQISSVVPRTYGWHKVKYDLAGNYLKIYIDDILAQEGLPNDPSPYTFPYFDKVGLISQGGVIYFDNISVIRYSLPTTTTTSTTTTITSTTTTTLRLNEVFYDDFEMDLSKWTGGAAYSQVLDQVYSGIKSLGVTNGILYAANTTTVDNGIVEGYFFFPINYTYRSTTSYHTIELYKDNYNSILGRIGINLGISPTTYLSCINNCKATNISRTDSWHKFKFELINNYFKLYIDDILVDEATSRYPNFNKLGLVSANGLYIYFDDIYIYQILPPINISSYFYDDFETDLSIWNWRAEAGSNYSLVSDFVYNGTKALKLDYGKISSRNTPIISNGTVEAFFFDTFFSDGYTGVELWADSPNMVIGRADIGWSNYYLTQIGTLQVSTVVPRTYGWHKVKYKLEGGYLKIYIDDILAQEGIPMKSYFDRVGLISSNSPIYFDGITVISYSSLTDTEVDSCLDSDGLNISNRGMVSGYYSLLPYNYTDHCRTNDSFLVEYYCTDSYPIWSSRAYHCEDITSSMCSNGSCPIIFNPKQILYEDFETDLSSWEITGLAQITNEIKLTGQQAANITGGSKISRKFEDFKNGRIEVHYFDTNQRVVNSSDSGVSILSSSDRAIVSLLINSTYTDSDYRLVVGERYPYENAMSIGQFNRSYGWHNLTFEFEYMPPINTYVTLKLFIDKVLASTISIPDFYLNELSIFNNVLSPQKYEVYVDDIRAYNYLPSLNLSDIDGDGIIDTEDRLIGDLSNVATNIPTLDLVINQTRLSLQSISSLTGSQSIKVQEGVKDLVDLIWDFDTNTLNLSGITINKQEPSEQKGWLIVKGISLTDSTKTIYIDNIDQTSDTVCIKDAEINSIGEISSTCNGDDEVLIACPGTVGQYTCEIVNGRYKISGLRNSGVIEVPTEAPPTTGGGGGGSGGGGGGGGGGTPLCPEAWSCGPWSECVNQEQTRVCIDFTRCGTTRSKPETVQKCVVRAKPLTTTSTTLVSVETLVPEERIELSFLERNKTKIIVSGIAVVLIALVLFKKRLFKKKR